MLLFVVQSSSKSIFLAPNIAVFLSFRFRGFFSHSISSILFYLRFSRWGIILYVCVYIFFFVRSLCASLCFFSFVCTLSLGFYLFHPRCVLFYVVTSKLCKYDAILSSEWQTAVDFDIHFYHNTPYLWQWQERTIANAYLSMYVF